MTEAKMKEYLKTLSMAQIQGLINFLQARLNRMVEKITER